MARHPDAKFTCDYAPTSKYFQLVLFYFVALFQHSVFSRPSSQITVGGGKENEVDNYEVNEYSIASSWPGILLSLSSLIIVVSLLALCAAGGCCGKIQWFGRRRQDAPLSFSNPMTEPGSTMMIPISQIDVRALELDPIVFEPLPTVYDLTPLSNKINSDRRQSNHVSATIPIVPFSADDSSVYAHDWFEEPHDNFPRTNIEYVKEIGKGWFGQVIEAEARDIVPFARKIRVIVKLLREDANGIEQMRFLDESRIYRDGNHGNILKLLGHSIEKLPFLLIMEHCPQGDLKSFLISNVTRAEMLNNQGTIAKMALDVANGLQYMHNEGCVHPDLAARSCRVGSENRVVIGDYGLGTQNYRDDYHWSSNAAIPLRWTAPETLHCTANIIQILKVTESSNIWSLGVVMWEICEFGKLPYFELSDDDIISRVIIEKKYFLGRPTLPYMSAKEELYGIMSSCWKPEIEDRPYLSTIIQQLENLCKTFNFNAISPKDEFDSKWEQLGSRTGSEEDKRRKKNVSFVGIESRVRPFEIDTSMDENEAMRNANLSGITSSVSNLSQDISLEHSKEIIDPEEEQWTQKFERGEITQKVLEKSQSVQDLMVLTHFEQSDIGDLDSLVYVTKTHQSSASDEKENESMNSTLRKSSSETAIDSLYFANSSQSLTPSTICDNSSQSSTLVPTNVTPCTTPNTPSVEINILSATPNPPVEINVIQATPNPSCRSESDQELENSPSKPELEAVNRKLNFKLNFSPETTGRQRLTSTPLRSGSTPSPRISDFEDNDADNLPVFEFGEHYMEGTFSISPISQHQITTSSLSSSKLEKSTRSESSVVFGASNDHELGSYQGVKSQLHEIADFHSQLQIDSEDEESGGEKSIFGETKVLPRRILFPNGVADEGKLDLTIHESQSPLKSGESRNGGLNEASSVSSFVTSGNAESSHLEANEHDEFWKQQLKSLQVAAGNTRELFQIGLDYPDDAVNTQSTADKRFVEDIEAAAEELGSLVLHDLEESDPTQIVIKETREAIEPEAGVKAKLAFESNAASTSTKLCLDEISTSDIENDSETWAINNSIEIRKVHEENKTAAVLHEESDFEDFEEAIAKEFKPSKWDQSLVPSRPAIKSPEQQPKSGLKKSVSFEMKKTQLVYEYPPPPVASDSEEEEKLITPLASSSIPLSSSLDWELTQEELEDAEINHEDWDDEVLPKAGDPMDVYRISGFSDDNFQVRGSSEPFVFSPATLGELRHTRDRLRLDLSRGEANFLEEDPSKSNPAKLDSGVGSSTNVSPFNNCDILTKRSKPNE